MSIAGPSSRSDGSEAAHWARQRVIRLTTIGRKSGLPRTVQVWFVVTGPGEIAVQHVRGPTAQWYLNLKKHPEVTVDFGDGPVHGYAQVVNDRAEVQRILREIRRKYGLIAWLLQLLGTSKAVAAKIRLERGAAPRNNEHE